MTRRYTTSIPNLMFRIGIVIIGLYVVPSTQDVVQGMITMLRKYDSVTIMPLGASITWGYGSTSGNGYRAALLESLDATHYLTTKVFSTVGNIQSGNSSHSAYSSSVAWPGRIITQCTGNLTEYLQPQQTSSSSSLCPTLTLIHAGTNDLQSNATVRSLAPLHLGDLLDTLFGLCPRTATFVAQLIPSSNPQIDAYIRTFNAAVPGVVAVRAGKGFNVVAVDMFDALNASTDLHDHIHPNDAGYLKMARTWQVALDEAERKGWF